VNQMDQLAAKRCKALLSVDDAYVGIVDAVEASGQLNNTYVLLSSDHGYLLKLFDWSWLD
jgi:arylsulfatase A-like enzyme